MQQESSIIFSAICRRITARMEERGLTKIELARRSGVSYKTVWDITKGKGRPRPNIIDQLAPILRVDANYLIEGKDAKPETLPARTAVSSQAYDGNTISETVAKSLRNICVHLELPENVLWACLQEAIEKKRKTVSDRHSKAG